MRLSLIKMVAYNNALTIKEGLMDKSIWNSRLLKCYAATVEILKHIKEETGHGYKELYSLKLLDHKDCPTWAGKDAKSGVIEIGYNHDPEAVAASHRWPEPANRPA